METYMIPVVTAFFGTLGFSAYYNVGLRIAAVNAACSMAGYFAYMMLYARSGSIFMSNLLTAVIITVASELLARRFRVPTTMLLVPMLFPEIPGSSLYNMVWSLFVGETGLSLMYGIELVKIIAALNLGIVLVTALIKIWINIRDRMRWGRYEGYR